MDSGNEKERMIEQRFQQLMEKVTNFAIVFQDVSGIIQEWNVGAENLFGWSRDEAIGQSIHLFFTPTDRANGEPEKEMSRAAAKGKAEDERWHLRRDGSLFYASGLLHAIYEEGVLGGYVKIVRDLTERVSLEAALHDARNFIDTKVFERTSELNEHYKVLTLEADKRERDLILHSALVRRVLITQEDERKRIARDLHDHLGQKMTGLRLMIANLKTALEKDEKLRDGIEKLGTLAGDIDSDLSFLVWELRPATIDELGLEDTLENFVNEWSRQFEIPVDLKIERIADKDLPSVAEINLYRIVQEAMNNIAKYASCTKVTVTLTKADNSILVTVKDNGVGFDPERKKSHGKGLGLLGMGERASILQGKLEIESAEGKGTTVRVQVPALFVDAAAAGL